MHPHQAPVPHFCSYVQAIPPGSYREVFKSQLTPAMIGYLVAGLGTADAASLEFAEAALRELSGVQRCGVLAAGVSKQAETAGRWQQPGSRQRCHPMHAAMGDQTPECESLL
jgi:hypothetical protein